MAKKRYLKMISKYRNFVYIIYIIYFITDIFVDIFGHMGEKQFFQRDLKKSTFILNFDISEDMDKVISKKSIQNQVGIQKL